MSELTPSTREAARRLGVSDAAKRPIWSWYQWHWRLGTDRTSLTESSQCQRMNPKDIEAVGRHPTGCRQSFFHSQHP